MKYILTLFCLVSFVAYGQEPAYTPMRLNYQFRGIKVDSLFLIPSFNDTTAANNSTMKNVAGAMIRTGNDFYMRNATLNAWLQNVNVGTGASPSIQFVDSVWRVAGKDSIFWRKGGTTNKIKDSTGGGNSPDRINGTATNNVNAEMGLWQMRFNGSNAATSSFVLDSMATVSLRSDSIVLDGYNTVTADVIFRDLKRISTNSVDVIDMTANSALAFSSGDSTRISGTNKIDIGLGNRRHVTQGNKYEFKDFNNTFIRIDTLGNFEAGDLTTNQLTIALSKNDSAFQIQSKAPSTWREGNSGFKSQIKTGYPKNDIDLSAGNYEIKLPGVYSVSTAHASNTLILPDPANWGGQSITIINKDGAVAIAYGGGFNPYIYDGTQISTQWISSIVTLYSDSNVWFAIYNK